MSSSAHVNNGRGISDPNKLQKANSSLTETRDYFHGIHALLLYSASSENSEEGAGSYNPSRYVAEKLSELRSSHEDSLRFLTDQSLISRGPLVFILVLMMMIGVTVNSLVTVVFLKRFPASALRSFIVTMSVADLVATVVGIPCYIYTLLHAYSFKHPEVCQVFFTITSLSTNLSSFVITFVAMDRVRRVQNPSFKETDKIRSYYQVAVTVFLAVAVTVPFVPLYGIQTAPTYSGFPARMCWIDDSYKDTVYAQVYLAVLAGTFGLTFFLMFVSYFIIGYRIHVLTRDLRAELTYTLEHPPPVSKNMHIYDETSEELLYEQLLMQSPKHSQVHSPKQSQLQLLKQSQLQLLRASELQLQITPATHESDERKRSSMGGALSFAERLHSPQHYMAQLDVQYPDARMARISKIKKLSNAIHEFFQPGDVTSSALSTSDSSFISKRAHGSFSKTAEKTATTKETSEKKFREHPSFHTKSLIVATTQPMNFIMDSVLTTSELVESATSVAQPSGAPRVAQRPSNNSAAAAKPSKEEHPPDKLTKGKELVPPGTKTPGTLEADRQALPTASKTSELRPIQQESRKSLLGPRISSASKGKSSSGHVRLVEDNEEGKARRVSKKDSRHTRLALLQQDQLRLETLATLKHLKKIQRSSRNTMILLVVFFAFTWLPNLLARLVTKEPAQYCRQLHDCWTNVASYSISSVFINSTMNAFFNCFGSVHFRKQVKFFIKPFKDRICPKKRRRRTIRSVSKKATTPRPPPVEPPPDPPPDPPPEEEEEVKPAQVQQDNCPLQPVTPGGPADTMNTSTLEETESSTDSSNEQKSLERKAVAAKAAAANAANATGGSPDES